MQAVKLIAWVACLAAMFSLVGLAVSAEPQPGAFGGVLVTVGSDGTPDIADWQGAISAGWEPSLSADGQSVVLRPKLAANAKYKIRISGVIPPGPGPKPDPKPDPKPLPTPGPLYCLMVYESAELVKLPITQSSIVTSKLIRDYLASHAAKGLNGPEFRFLDKDSDPSKLPPNLKAWFSDAAAAFKASGKPQIAITNGKDTFKGEWPATVDAMLQLLQQYGGK